MIGVRSLRLSQVLPMALAAILLGFTTPAMAEGADHLFSEGLSLMKADHCQDALPLFIESQNLDPAAATLTNIATCYVRLGKTASAYRVYQEASRAAILERKPELQRHTDQALAALGPTLTRLKIVPLGSNRLPEIRINGELIADVREPIPLDPGENIVEAIAPDRDPWRRTVRTLTEGALLVVEVPDLASPPPSAAAVTAPPQTKQEAAPLDDGPHTNLKPYAVLAAGVGATGLTLGTILAFSAHSRLQDSERYCSGHYCLNEGVELRDEADDRATIATWSVGLGIVSLATAVILWTNSPSVPAKLSYEPVVQVGQRSAFISLRGSL